MKKFKKNKTEKSYLLFLFLVRIVLLRAGFIVKNIIT